MGTLVLLEHLLAARAWKLDAFFSGANGWCQQRGPWEPTETAVRSRKTGHYRRNDYG